jgi:hypothetical protein
VEKERRRRQGQDLADMSGQALAVAPPPRKRRRAAPFVPRPSAPRGASGTAAASSSASSPANTVLTTPMLESFEELDAHDRSTCEERDDAAGGDAPASWAAPAYSRAQRD